MELNIKNLLITGGSGYLGINLANKFKQKYKVFLGSRNQKRNREASNITGCKDIPLDWLPWSTTEPLNTASPNTEPVIKLTTVIGRHNCSYEDLQFITSWLCRKNEFAVLRTAFRIFDPSNVLVDFLLF